MVYSYELGSGRFCLFGAWLMVKLTDHSRILRPRTLEKFENAVSTLKTHQMSSVHTPPRRNLKTHATTSDDFGFVFDENSGRGITSLSPRHHFPKPSFSKCFPSTQKRKAGVLNSSGFEVRLRNVPFLWRASVDSRPNSRKTNATFTF